MSKVSTEVRPRRNRDAEILEAATHVFHEKGYQSASLQDIADRVGILKGSLYHYISSKESLLFRILQDSHQDAQDLADAINAMSLPPERKLPIYVERLTLWYLEHLERSSLYLNEWRYLQGEYRATVREQRRQFQDYFSTIINEAAERGLTRPDLDAELATRFILSAISTIPGWYRTSPPPDREHVARELATFASSIVFLK